MHQPLDRVCGAESSTAIKTFPLSKAAGPACLPAQLNKEALQTMTRLGA